MPNFENLIGNEKIKIELTETMENQTISHSYMFVGKSGIGKRLFAREFAKGLLGDFNKDIEGLRLLHGLETNLANSLQTPQEA